MTKEERDKVRQIAAKNGGDLKLAAMEFIGVKPTDDGGIPIGNEGPVLNIADECGKYAELDGVTEKPKARAGK